MVTCKRFLLKRYFVGLPQTDDFELILEELPELQDGEFLAEAEFLSVDPFMRGYSKNRPLGSTMIGGQVAKVIESRNDDYPVGIIVVGYWGWRTHTIVDPKVKPDGMINLMWRLPDLKGLSPSYGLGPIGRPGNAAYFGFLEICQPKAGDVVVISGAAGAVGSLVGQIAKIKGCYVIGFAGTDDKVDWLVNNLEFDKAYNYKTADWDESLKEAAPEGIDCYFDNVGGKFSATVRNHMKDYGRISVCGSISLYNDGSNSGSPFETNLVGKQLRMEGFLVHRWMDRWMEGFTQMVQWIHQGKIKVRETIAEGFDKMPGAFIDMLQGGNTGKAIIKV